MKIPCPVSITDNALVEVRKIYREKKIPEGYGLRIGVNGGGCTGVSYFIGFDHRKDKDEVFEYGQILLFIEKRHAMFLWGVVVDFVETSEERGFVLEQGK